MTNEETILMLRVGINGKREKIKFNKAFYPEQDNEQLEKDIEVYETAIGALEKQVPKMLKNKEKSNHPIIVFTGNCPSCGRLTNEYCSDTYCMWCGQKLDWSEEE